MGRSKKYHNDTERQEAKKRRERERRAAETNDERNERLRKLSVNAQKRRAEETAEERKQRLRRLSQNESKRRTKETNEERYERLKKLSQYARNRRAAGSNNHNTRLVKIARDQKQNANGYIKVNLLKYYDVQEDQHQEQMQHNPENNISLLKRSSRLGCASTLQLHHTHTNNVQKGFVQSESKWKRKATKTATVQIKDIIPDTISRQRNSKVSKTRRKSTSHSVFEENSVFPQPTIPNVHEKRILVVPNHQAAVMSNLYSLWKARRLCDSYISNGATNVLVHKMVLGAVCPKLLPVLHQSSKGSFPKVIFPSSVSREGLLAFAEYMYSGVLDLNEDILVQLKIIGEKLQMKDFEELCCQELKKAKAKDMLSTVVEPCSLSGLFPSRTQGDTNEVQNSMLMKFLGNIYSNNSVQTDVAVTIASTATSSTSSAFDVRSVENMVTNQIDIKTEVEPELEPATSHNPLQLKLEPCSLGENQYSIQEELCVDIDTINNNVQLKPAASATSGNISKDNELTITYSSNQCRNDLNMDSCEVIYISDIDQSEETCLSQHSEDCNKYTDNQKELQLMSVTSATGNISEDSLSNNSDLIEISSTIYTNTETPQTSNSRPYPVSLFSVNGSENATL